jgi:two-component system chemotaxis response regulator CheB
VARTLLVSILESDPGLSVVGQATNGREAVEMAARLQPDVITMDVHMPVMDGLEATRQIMERTPRPIVFVSANDPKEVRGSFRALEAGALAVLGKPNGPTSPDFPRQAAELKSTVKAMSGMRVVTRRPRRDVGAPPSAPPDGLARPLGAGGAPAPEPDVFRELPAAEQRRVDLVAIGSSTGGPAALAKILGALPADLPVPVLVVQHITPGFDRGLAEWLDGISPLTVGLARDGQPLRPGEVLIAPCDSHLGVSSANRTAVLAQGGAVDGHRPSATQLFTSVARAYGRHVLGVILTGMGEDGATGLVSVQQAGGWIVAQDEASCVVYGMPAAAVARGVVNEQVALDDVASTILTSLRRGRATRAA